MRMPLSIVIERHLTGSIRPPDDDHRDRGKLVGKLSVYECACSARISLMRDDTESGKLVLTVGLSQ